MKRILLAVIIIIIVSISSQSVAGNSHDFNRGVNMALDAIMLLDLELKLKGERKTWGEMAEIVRKRLGTPKTDNKANSSDTKNRAAD